MYCPKEDVLTNKNQKNSPETTFLEDWRLKIRLNQEFEMGLKWQKSDWVKIEFL